MTHFVPYLDLVRAGRWSSLASQWSCCWLIRMRRHGCWPKNCILTRSKVVSRNVLNGLKRKTSLVQKVFQIPLLKYLFWFPFVRFCSENPGAKFCIFDQFVSENVVRCNRKLVACYNVEPGKSAVCPNKAFIVAQVCFTGVKYKQSNKCMHHCVTDKINAKCFTVNCTITRSTHNMMQAAFLGVLRLSPWLKKALIQLHRGVPLFPYYHRICVYEFAKPNWYLHRRSTDTRTFYSERE